MVTLDEVPKEAGQSGQLSPSTSEVGENAPPSSPGARAIARLCAF
jgi:hypothetical protein